MIIYCAADPVYFELYYNLWIGQLKKYYPEYDKLIALYKPTEEIIDRCKKDNVETIDVSDSLPENPTRNHFYLLRWINLPYQKNKLILETQINCIARKKQSLDCWKKWIIFCVLYSVVVSKKIESRQWITMSWKIEGLRV